MTWADVTRTLPAPVVSGPALPSAYACRDRIDQLGVPFNGVGWAWNSDCSLAAGSTLFFSMPPDAQCLELDLTNAGEGDAASIEIALGSVRLDRIAPNVYCAPGGYRRNPTAIEIASFKWISGRRVVAQPASRLQFADSKGWIPRR